MKTIFYCLLTVAFFDFAAYSLIMWPIFQWRNPKANSMTYYSEFKSVLSFQKLDKYQ